MENRKTKKPTEELEKGKWPSYVTEWKRAGYSGLVELYSRALEDKKTHFKHGGMVGYPGYDSGVVGRLSDMPEILESSHLIRVYEPAGWFYSTESLRKIADIWKEYGSGVISFHGAQGDMQLVGVEKDMIEPAFEELAKINFDIGSSGASVRTLATCAGPALCELCNIDTLDMFQTIGVHFIEDTHRPRFPYKFKIKISGCSNDCVAATARADFAIIGNFKDEIKIDQDALKEYPVEVIERVVARCPTKCMSYIDGGLGITMEDCTRCMHCINMLSKALSPGDDKGVTVLIGAKSRGRLGAFMGWVLIPFMEIEPPYTKLINVIEEVLEWWDENALMKERVGETIYRIGYNKFLSQAGKKLGIKPSPEMVVRPRANPFWSYSPGEVE